MPSKEQIILELKDNSNTQKNFKKAAVVDLINSISTGSKNKKPVRLHKGDVFIHITGNKARPCVAIKVKKDVVYAIPISSTVDCLNMNQGKSRFFGESFFSKSIVGVKYEDAIKNFVGVYDDRKALKIAIETIKQEILSL